MRHNSFRNLWEEALDHSDEVLIYSKSKRFALYIDTSGETHFLGGDFTGSPQECEAEARRILRDVPAQAA